MKKINIFLAVLIIISIEFTSSAPIQNEFLSQNVHNQIKNQKTCNFYNFLFVCLIIINFLITF
jgi:uncharacterized membrane protein